jgi:WD40 repeat protein
MDKDYIISCSEDGFTKVFNNPFGSEPFSLVQGGEFGSFKEQSIDLNLLRAYRGHGNKSVWCFDVVGDKLYTGGSDAGIRSWNLKDIKTENYLVHISSIDSNPKSFCFLSSTKMIILFENGVFAIKDSHKSAAVVYESVNFGKSPVMKYCNDTKLLCCSNMHGQVVLSNLEKFVEHKIAKVKIQDIFINIHGLFVFTSEDNSIEYYRIGSDLSLELKARFDLPLEFFVTSIYYDDGILVAGSRKGSVALFGPLRTPEKNAPFLIHSNLHKTDAVTSLLLRKEASSQILYSLGRDGFIRKSIFNGNTLCPNFEQRLTKGWLEHFLVISDKIHICGFFDQKLFVYDLEQNCEILSIRCGGGHRVWDVLPLMDGKILVGYYKNKCIYNAKSNSAGGESFLDPYHCNETRAVKIAQFKSTKDCIVSAGEDGVLSVHDWNLKLLLSYRISDASIKCLTICGDYILTGGSEQQLKLWKIDETGLHFIGGSERIHENMEVRVMTAKLMPHDGGWIVATGNSDMYMCIWTISRAGNFKLVNSINIHHRCMQKLDLVQYGIHFYGVSSATSGEIIIWTLNETFEIRVIFKLRAFQSGVKCLDTLVDHDNLYICAGGDDGSVVYIHYEKTTPVLLSKSDAHGSAVTGCKLISKSKFTSASIDERINIYEVKEDGLKIVDSLMVDIPDISDMDLNSEIGCAVVVGHGIQTIAINSY